MTRSTLIVVIAALAFLWPFAGAQAQDHGVPAGGAPAPATQPAHAPDPGHAPAEAHEDVGVMPTVKQGLVVATTSIVVFVIVLVILSTMVWPKIVKGLSDREAKIREEIESAERARKQAKDALAQYEKSLAEARAEAQRMLEATKASQQALAAELRAKADAEMTALKDRARRDIESAKRAALKEIYDAAGDLAANMAAKILRREVQPGDTRRLMEESLGELQTAKV